MNLNCSRPCGAGCVGIAVEIAICRGSGDAPRCLSRRGFGVASRVRQVSRAEGFLTARQSLIDVKSGTLWRVNGRAMTVREVCEGGLRPRRCQARPCGAPRAPRKTAGAGRADDVRKYPNNKLPSLLSTPVLPLPFLLFAALQPRKLRPVHCQHVTGIRTDQLPASSCDNHRTPAFFHARGPDKPGTASCARPQFNPQLNRLIQRNLWIKIIRPLSGLRK